MDKNRHRRARVYEEELSDLRKDLAQLVEEERAAYLSTPEGLRGSERGRASEEVLSNLEDAVAGIDEALYQLAWVRLAPGQRVPSRGPRWAERMKPAPAPRLPRGLPGGLTVQRPR